MTVSGKTQKKSFRTFLCRKNFIERLGNSFFWFLEIGPFFRVYSLSIRLSLQRTRHTNQTSVHVHLCTKFFPPSLFLWHHMLHQFYFFASGFIWICDTLKCLHSHQLYYRVEIWHKSFVSVWSVHHTEIKHSCHISTR